MRAALVAPGVDRRGIATLGLGHLCSDMCQGAVPALLPFLIEQRGYSYGQATALVLAMTVGSALLQPLFGHFADRRSLPWLMPLGVLTGGVGVAAVGFTDGYGATLVLVTLAGVGVGAFHPEAARWANYVSGPRRASGMSLFSVGGNAGFALGPVLVTGCVLALGLEGVALLVLPPAAVALLLAAQLPHLRSFHPDLNAAAAHADAGGAVDRWGPFARLAGVAAGRSGVYFGLQAFVASYFVVHFGSSTAAGNAALVVVLAAGALGTLVGGPLADRIGNRPVLIGCMAALSPLLALFLLSGAVGGYLVLALIGFFCIGNFSITVVLGQEYLPNRLGVASGVTLGAAIGAGGLIAAALGLLADHTSLTTVMVVIALMPIPTLLLALSLPREAS